jgi:hypothetical protein
LRAVSYQIVIVGFFAALAEVAPTPTLTIDRPSKLVHATTDNDRRCHFAQRLLPLDDLTLSIPISP